MVEKVENLILERLRRIDDRLATIEGDMSDVKTRITALDEQMHGVMTSIVGLNSRMDRFDERLGRVERRLDLKDAS
jgi:hypothetical protein